MTESLMLMIILSIIAGSLLGIAIALAIFVGEFKRFVQEIEREK